MALKKKKKIVQKLGAVNIQNEREIKKTQEESISIESLFQRLLVTMARLS